MPIVNDGYYWILRNGDDEWRVAQAFLTSKRGIEWYECGCDVPSYHEEVEVGSRITYVPA